MEMRLCEGLLVAHTVAAKTASYRSRARWRIMQRRRVYVFIIRECDVDAINAR